MARLMDAVKLDHITDMKQARKLSTRPTNISRRHVRSPTS